MAVASWFAIYFLIWWVALFAVLPFGIRSHAEAGDIVPGSDPGAPIRPRLWLRLLWTTLIAALLFGLFVLAWQNDIAGLRAPR